MPTCTHEPVTIAVDDGVQRLRPAASAAAGARLLCARAWRRRRHEPSVHGGGRGRARGAPHRDVALPVPLHGARQQAARSAEARACRGPRRRGRSRPAIAEAAAHRRRQIVRRPDDLAGAGRGAAAGRSRTGVPRLSAASGEAAVAGPRQASVRRASADAVPARHARRARACSISSSRCARSSARARRLRLFEGADHSFHVPARSGRTDAQVMARHAGYVRSLGETVAGR